MESHTLIRALAVPITAAAAVTTSPSSQADTAIVVPGAYPLGSRGNDDSAFSRGFGANYYTLPPDFTVQVIDYARDGMRVDESVDEGVSDLETAINTADGPVVVTGVSMGAMVAEQEQATLATDPNAPPREHLKFIRIASPQSGVARLVPAGTRIPIANYTVQEPTESQYDTIIVIGEYDGWADPPDRPWNLVATVNAILGIQYVHGPTAFTDPDDVPPENVTVTTNSKGATTTTYLVPTKHLPLTQPLRDKGVPGPIVDLADRALRPIVDAGYVRHDEPNGPPRPYLSHGQIRVHRPSDQPAAAFAVADPPAAGDKDAQSESDITEESSQPRTSTRDGVERRQQRDEDRDGGRRETQQDTEHATRPDHGTGDNGERHSEDKVE
jgi:hypothetical protein